MHVGLRVVRGPDWKWQNQDNGEGNVGTVVEVGRVGNSTTPDKTVVVQWDSGFRTNYRVGYKGLYDLRVYDTAPTGAKHLDVVCQGCQQQNIEGIRWKCSVCANYDLCQLCYMNDVHDISHVFTRLDYSDGNNSSSTGVKVPLRNGAVKIDAKGIFAGARVVRGPDWDWGNQDGGSGKTGIVLDIRGWESESGRSVANIAWDKGTVVNVYRLGHKGKVDLKYVQESSGGAYYRDHLPKLGAVVDQSTDSAVPRASLDSSGQNVAENFSVGDRVVVELDVSLLKSMQEGHGGWNPKMSEFIGVIGTVHRITDRGDVRVQYDGCSNRWTFHAAALRKIESFSEYDTVCIIDNVELIKTLQHGHGEWAESMRELLGKQGTVLKIYADGDLRVKVGSKVWTMNPKCCKIVPRSQQDYNRTMTVELRERDAQSEVTRQMSSLKAVLSSDATPTSCCSSISSHAPATHDISPDSAEPSIPDDPDRLVKEAAQGRLEAVKTILTRHPDKVNVKSSGKTALQVAAHQGHIDVVKFLLNSGASFDSRDEEGDYPLHYAAFGNQPEVMSMLLARGANVKLLNSSGCSALHVSVNKQHIRCVEILIKHSSCDVNLQDSYGDTSLHDAVSKDSADILELLLNVPNVNTMLVNKRGFNILHHAALKGNEIATDKILSKSGQQLVDVKKDDGFSALHLAALNGHLKVSATLIDKGQANIEITNNRRQTPLLLAVSQGHADVVELLVNKGASLQAIDEEGQGCLRLAMQRQQMPTGLENAPTIQRIYTELQTELPIPSPGLALACYLLQSGAVFNLHQVNRPDAVVMKLLERYRRLGMIGCNRLSGPASLVDCKVCSNYLPEVTFRPCGHCIVCLLCSTRMRKCLECSAVITEKVGPGGEKDEALDALIEIREATERWDRSDTSHSSGSSGTRICDICMENIWNVVFKCGHMACSKCADAIKICHMCRKPIEEKINIFT